MSMSDPIADLLTRIRNAQRADKPWVDIPSSNLKKRICVILKEEHFIRDFILVTDPVQGRIRVFLSYDHNNEPVIDGLVRISKPGCRVYAGAGDIPRVRGGLGISILTTSKGVISNKVARRLNVGGEILCQVW
ncbi:MAG: 30S ribosomal protein S8 [Candidatus Marinimicrobia bacterium]|nr:30S ribosomal protein S8 [Candidatus Neomarinimicrobiota bacterium]MCH8837529.1 30S ribosomal protein S8 [Candidatus Neomarinimicrobiota bacterium]